MQTLVGLFDLNQKNKTFDHCYEEKLVQISVDCFGFKQKQPTYLKMFDVFLDCIETLIEILQSNLHTP